MSVDKKSVENQEGFKIIEESLEWFPSDNFMTEYCESLKSHENFTKDNLLWFELINIENQCSFEHIM